MNSIIDLVKHLHSAVLRRSFCCLLVAAISCSVAMGQGHILIFENLEGPGVGPGWISDSEQGHWMIWSGGPMVNPGGVPAGVAYSGTNVFRAWVSYLGYWARLQPSSSIDLSSYAGSQVVLSFAMYHDNYAPVYNSQLTVQASLDGGGWSDLQTYGRYQAGPNHWTVNTIDLSSYAGQANFRFGFLAVSAGGGSNVFIDDIALTVVPEPGVYSLFAMGVTSTWFLRRNRVPKTLKGSANGSEPIRSEINRTSSAAGSRR